MVDLAEGAEPKGLTPLHVLIAGPLDDMLTTALLDAALELEYRLAQDDAGPDVAERYDVLCLFVAQGQPMAPTTRWADVLTSRDRTAERRDTTVAGRPLAAGPSQATGQRSSRAWLWWRGRSPGRP